MKKTLAFFLAALLLAACTGEDLPESEFSLSDYPVNDPATALPAGGTVELVLKWDESWTITSSQPWLSVRPSEGKAGKYKIRLTTEPNESAQVRDAVLTLSSESKTSQLTIRQNPNIYNKTFLQTKKVFWSFSWIYNSSAHMSRSRLLMPYPETSEYQVVRDQSYGTAQLKTSRDGVKYLLDDRSGVFPASGEPFIQQTFTVDYYDVRVDFDRIVDRNIPYDKASADYKRYTAQIRDDDGSFMIDPQDGRIVQVSQTLWEESDGKRIEFARLCYNWVMDNITYGIYDGPNSINDILNRMSGDCGNQHAVWMSLMRASGIPARPIVMKAPDPDGYSHVRAEFYMPGYGWIPVDPTNEQGTGEDYFGAFKYEPLVIMNHDFGFMAEDRTNQPFICGLLQGLSVCVWGSGDFAGKEIFKFVE